MTTANVSDIRDRFLRKSGKTTKDTKDTKDTRKAI